MWGDFFNMEPQQPNGQVMRMLRLGVSGVPNNACEIWYMQSLPI